MPKFLQIMRMFFRARAVRGLLIGERRFSIARTGKESGTILELMVERTDEFDLPVLNEGGQEWIRHFLSQWEDGLGNLLESIPEELRQGDAAIQVLVKPWYSERVGNRMKYEFDIGIAGVDVKTGKSIILKEIGGLSVWLDRRQSEYVLDTLKQAKRITREIPTCDGAMSLASTL